MVKANIRARISWPIELGEYFYFDCENDGPELPYVFLHGGIHYTWSGNDDEQSISRSTEAEILLYEKLQRVMEELDLCRSNCGDALY